MIRYILLRLASTIPILIGVSALVFILMQVIPGDPVAIFQRDFIDPDALERVRREMHLDDPPLLRYGHFLKGALTGNLGYSYKMKRLVNSVIAAAFPNTLKLAACAALVSWVIGVSAGVVSAVKPGSKADNLLMGFSLAGVSMPTFWAALVFQYIFGVTLGLLPVAGFESWRHLILPVAVLGWGESGIVARLTRSSLLDAMKHDYVRTARSKGLAERAVIRVHALKNALLPVVTIMAIQISGLLSGSIVTESVFGIPGIGRLAITAIHNRDMPLLQGTVMFGTFLVIVCNIVADTLYATLDPRIKYVKE